MGEGPGGQAPPDHDCQSGSVRTEHGIEDARDRQPQDRVEREQDAGVVELATTDGRNSNAHLLAATYRAVRAGLASEALGAREERQVPAIGGQLLLLWVVNGLVRVKRWTLPGRSA